MAELELTESEKLWILSDLINVNDSDEENILQNSMWDLNLTIESFHLPHRRSNFFSWLFQSHPSSLTPIREMNSVRQYVGNSIFYFSNYSEAISRSLQTSKCLLLCLVSPFQFDSDTFCKQVLGSISFQEYAMQNLVVWLGSVWNPEPLSLSQSLCVGQFPCILLCSVLSNTKLVPLFRIDGL